MSFPLGHTQLKPSKYCSVLHNGEEIVGDSFVNGMYCLVLPNLHTVHVYCTYVLPGTIASCGTLLSLEIHTAGTTG
jgi:hypothetical protein